MALNQVSQVLLRFRNGQSNFDHLLIKRADFQAQYLPLVSLKKACLPEANFRHSILPGSDFSGAILRRSNFDHANLLAIDADWVDFKQANLSHVLLSRASLVGTDLSGANLTGASLADADLSSANLRNANLTGANLCGVNLSKANLFGARIDPNALAGAVLDFTVMPNGECHTQAAHAKRDKVGVANMMSYTRLAKTLETQRTNRLQSAILAEKSAPHQSESPSVHPQATQPLDAKKSMQFRFSEESGGDLSLAIIESPEDP